MTPRLDVIRPHADTPKHKAQSGTETLGLPRDYIKASPARTRNSLIGGIHDVNDG